MENFTLKFGKYKGKEFLSTPKSYQTWLITQDWFKVPSTEEKMPRISSSWNGYSKKEKHKNGLFLNGKKDNL